MSPDEQNSARDGVRVVGAGVDSLYLGYRFSTAHGVEKALERHKAAARKCKKAVVDETTGALLKPAEREWVDVAGEYLEVKGHGASSAPFLLHGPDMHLAVNPAGDHPGPTLQVQILSEALWREGPEPLVERADAIAHELARNGVLDLRYVARIDPCVDHQGFEPRMYYFERFVSVGHSRMRPFSTAQWDRSALDKNLWFRTELEGMWLGSGGALGMRWYNKSKEIQKSGKTWMRHVYEKSADFNPDEPVWRLEPECRREFLKAVRIKGAPLETVEDVLRERGNLYRYVTNDWVRLTLADRSRLCDSTIHPKWAQLSATSALDDEAPARVTREEQLNAEWRTRLPALNGELARYGALKRLHSLDAVACELVTDLQQFNDERGTTWEARKERAENRYGLAQPEEGRHGIEKLGSAHGKARRRAAGAEGGRQGGGEPADLRQPAVA